jgi:phosphoglycerol transferase
MIKADFMKKINAWEALFLLISFIVPVILGWVFLGFSHFGINDPLVFNGDPVYYATVVQDVIEHGLSLNTTRLSAPFEFNEALFPAVGWSDRVVLLICSIFSSNPLVVFNLGRLFLFGLAGLTAHYCLRSLGLSRVIALSMAVAYACLPVATYRAVYHFSLSVYSAPPICACSILILRGEFGNKKKYERILYYASWGLAGFSYIYYSFYGFMLGGLTLFGSVVGSQRKMALRQTLVCLAVLTATSLMQVAPTLLYMSHDAIASDVFDYKYPGSGERSFLTFRDLITPGVNHPLPFFRDVRDSLLSGNLLKLTHLSTSGCGALSSLGLILLMGVAFSKLVRSKDRPILEALSPAAVLCLSLFFICSYGSIHSLVNLWLVCQFRDDTRVIPYLAFFCIYAIGYCLMAASSIGPAPLRKVGGVVFPILVGAAAVIDQHLPYESFNPPALHERDLKTVAACSKVVQELERRLPTNSMVFQLPCDSFPESRTQEIYMFYDHFRPYIFSKSLRWSYPADSSEERLWILRMMAGSPEAIVRRLVAEGFKAIWFNMGELNDEEKKIYEYAVSQTDASMAVFSAEPYAFVDLTQIKTPPDDVALDENEDYYQWGDHITFVREGNAVRFLAGGWTYSKRAPSAQTLARKNHDDSSNLLIPAAQSEQPVTLHILGAVIKEQGAQKIIVRVDDADVGEFTMEKFGEYKVVLPQSLFAEPHVMEIGLRAPGVRPLCADNPSATETRRLGAWIKEVWLTQGEK